MKLAFALRAALDQAVMPPPEAGAATIEWTRVLPVPMPLDAAERRPRYDGKWLHAPAGTCSRIAGGTAPL